LIEQVTTESLDSKTAIAKDLYNLQFEKLLSKVAIIIETFQPPGGWEVSIKE